MTLSKDRLGRFTSSEIRHLMGLRGLGKTGISYIFKNVAELITGELMTFSSKEVRHGHKYEPKAVSRFQEVTLKDVVPCDFVKKGEHEGATPDMKLVWENAYLEVKCHYNHYKHVEYMQYELKELRPEYWWQVQHGMSVCECEYWYFCSYVPGHVNYVHPDADLFVSRIERHDKDIKLMNSRIAQAIEIKVDMIEKYRRGENILLKPREIHEIKDKELTEQLYQSVKLMQEAGIKTTGNLSEIKF